MGTIHPDDRERVVHEWSKSVEQGTTFHQEYRWVHSDGRVIPTIGLVAPIKGSEGDVIQYVGTLTDLTECKQKEEMLRDSEERFRQLAENIQEVFYINDPKKRQVIYVSPAYEEIWAL